MATGSGAGGGGKDVRAGGAFVEIYAKDELTQQLAQVTAVSKQEMAKFNAAMKAGQAKALGNHTAVKGGFGGALGLVGLAGGLATMAKLTEAVFQAATGAQKFADALAEGRRLAGELADVLQRDRDKFFTSVGGRAAPDVKPLSEADQGKALRDRLAAKEKELADQNSRLAAARQGRVKLTEGETFGESAGIMAKKMLGDVPGVGRLFTEADTRAAEKMTADIEEMEAATKATRKEVQELRDTLQARLKGGGSPAGIAFRKDIEDQTRQLREQADAANKEVMLADRAAGLDIEGRRALLDSAAGDAKATEFRLKAVREGWRLSTDALNDYKAAAVNLKQVFDLKAAREQLRGLTDDLDTQLATWGKSAEEVQLFKLAATGLIPKGDLDNMRGLIAMKKDLEMQDKLAALTAAAVPVRAAFASPALSQQIGLSEKTGAQNTEYLRILSEGKGGLPKAIGQEIGKQLVAR